MSASNLLQEKSKLRSSKSKILSGDEAVSVSKRIDDIGFGPYQIKAFIFCAGSLLCESTSLSSISGVKTAIFDEFNITSDLTQALLMVVLYLGFTIGTIAAGPLGDSHGRRLPMLIGYVGIILTLSVVFIVRELVALNIFICILGFFAGIGVPPAATLLPEVTPHRFRGTVFAASAGGFLAGELWTSIGLRIFLPQLTGHWRHQLLWVGIPPLCLCLFGLLSRVTSFDSPEFLASHGRNKEVVGVLNLVAEQNGYPGEPLTADMSMSGGDEGESEITLSEVWSIVTEWPMGLYTCVLCICFFTYNFGYYGSIDFWPIGWEALNIQGIDKATELMYTALIGLLGLPVVLTVLSFAPRRAGLSYVSCVLAVATVMLQGLLSNSVIVGWAGVILFKIFWMTFQMTVMLLPGELYPTRVSVWAWSIVCFVGRIGCIIVPLVIAYSPTGFIVGLASLLLVSSLLIWWTPETKEVQRDEVDDLHSAKAEKSYGSVA